MMSGGGIGFAGEAVVRVGESAGVGHYTVGVKRFWIDHHHYHKS